MKFIETGIVKPFEHYAVSRPEVIDRIVTGLSNNEFLLLYSHKRTGKSSMIPVIIQDLAQRDNSFRGIHVCFQQMNFCSSQSFWSSLSNLITLSSEEIHHFGSIASFQKAFRQSSATGFQYALIIDEMDKLLHHRQICDEFLGVLRAMQQTSSIAGLWEPKIL